MSTRSNHALNGDVRRKALDAIQAKLKAATDKHDEVQRAPIASAEVRESILDELAREPVLASRVEGLFQHGHYPGKGLSAKEPLSLHDLAWLLGREAVADRLLEAATPFLARHASPIATPLRHSQLAEISEDIKALENEEEREVLRLFDSGVVAVRRDGANARALIDVWMADGEAK